MAHLSEGLHYTIFTLAPIWYCMTLLSYGQYEHLDVHVHQGAFEIILLYKK